MAHGARKWFQRISEERVMDLNGNLYVLLDSKTNPTVVYVYRVRTANSLVHTRTKSKFLGIGELFCLRWVEWTMFSGLANVKTNRLCSFLFGAIGKRYLRTDWSGCGRNSFDGLCAFRTGQLSLGPSYASL